MSSPGSEDDLLGWVAAANGMAEALIEIGEDAAAFACYSAAAHLLDSLDRLQDGAL